MPGAEQGTGGGGGRRVPSVGARQLNAEEYTHHKNGVFFTK